MKVTTEQLEDRVTRLIIEVDDEAVRPALEKAARQASSRFQIPGFRKGRAPYNVVAKLVGEEYLYQEALEEMAPALVERALKEQEIEPYSMPRITEVQTKPMRLTVSVPLEPTIELGDYREIHLEREPKAVTDEDVDEAIESLRKERALRQPIERTLQAGDWVTGHLIVKAEGEDEEAEENGPEEQSFQVPPAEKEGIPGLSEHLVGATVGDTIEFDTVLPADDPSAAGTPAHVTIEINHAEEEVLPEVDDEFAVLMGDYENLEALRTQLRERLEREAKEAAEGELRDKAIAALVEKATIKYPDAAVEDEMDRLVEAFSQRLQSQRISMDAYLKAVGLTQEQFRERQRESGEKGLRQALALREFIRAEGVSVTPEEMTARTDRAVSNVGAENPEMANLMRSRDFQRSMANNLLLERAMRRLVSVVTGEPEQAEEPWPLEEMPAPPASVVEVSEGEDQPPTEAAEETA
ncbi:MAG: trigger factor [Anaerolineae bacterium]